MNNYETKKVILVKYGEVSLRKGNRGKHEGFIMDTLRHSLNSEHNNEEAPFRVTREQGRFLIENPKGDLNPDEILPRISRIFGISDFCVAVKAWNTEGIADLCQIALQNFLDHTGGKPCTFRIQTKRSDKRYPLTSNQISAAIGEHILNNAPGTTVKLNQPDITLWVELRNYVYFYIDKIPGESGLPYGSSGRGVVLLSGGIDSPVAFYQMARRGVETIGVYFHSPPFVSERAADKVRDISKALAAYTGTVKLYIVPFTDVQLKLKEEVKPERLTIMLKRSMLRISEIIARAERAQCLITGDSIGQVASQTLHALAAVNSASTLPVMRPLAAMDKHEITAIAQKINTYSVSIRPFDDCCTLFLPKHPETKPKLSIIQSIEGGIGGLEELMERAITEAEVLDF